jgi:hypothetical protein
MRGIEPRYQAVGARQVRVVANCATPATSATAHPEGTLDLTCMNRDKREGIAGEFGIALDELEEYATRAADDRRLGPIRFEPELVSLAMAKCPVVAEVVSDFGQGCPHRWPTKSPPRV